MVISDAAIDVAASTATAVPEGQFAPPRALSNWPALVDDHNLSVDHRVQRKGCRRSHELREPRH
jgi:hypothetical protein